MKQHQQPQTISHFSLRINEQDECWIRYQVKQKSHRHNYKWKHSKHSRTRAAQRGFNYKTLLMAIEYGEAIHKQGMTYFVVQKKHLPEHLPNKIKDKLNNVVVVTSNYGQEIITCYKSHNAIKHINRKGKRLY